MIAPNDKAAAQRAAGDDLLVRDDRALAAETPLADELGQHLEHDGRADLAALREELQQISWAASPPGDALRRALERADTAELLTLAHRLGRDWLGGG